MRRTTRALVALAIGLPSAGCTIDTGKSEYCDRVLGIEGEVSGVEVADADYSMQSVWFNRSLEEMALSEIDVSIMKEMGLDPDDSEDVARYRYFNSAYDHRVLMIEELSETRAGSLGASIGQDLGVFFFDLEAHETQPGEEVAIFDASAIHTQRDNGDQDALGDAVRDVLDEMQANGQPDALVGFAPDRTSETAPERSLIVLLSRNAQYASGGTASFHSVVSLDGEDVESIEYQTDDIDAMSMSAAIEFGNEHVSVETTCFKTEVSGSAE